jgi:bifunctional non-homologous end joining protein LigD
MSRVLSPLSLQVYRRKRKFDVSPEPRGRARRGKGNQFVIQKHAARRLHYDLRLELDGVMKSWAVTRGPSLDPVEKRLAVQVEDHPVEYNAFEGTIPRGEYGGGTVLIWDRGRWLPEGDPHKGLAKGHLEFTLAGEKLQGRWHLVRMHRRAGETKEPWLLIKADDVAARRASDLDVLAAAPLSVASGRSIEEIAAGRGAERVWHSSRSVHENVKAGAIADAGAIAGGAATSARQRRPVGSGRPLARRKGDGAPLPDFVPPSLATTAAAAPRGRRWVHEIKFDGYRIQARIDDGKVRLLTRKGLDWARRFPNVAAAVATLPVRTALLDGEVVVEDEKGVSSFSGLQAALEAGEGDAYIYYVFDLLHLDGRDLTGLPLVERKAALARLVGKGGHGPIRYSEHFEDDGPVVLRHASRMSLEGIVSKRKDAPYRSGRSDAFIKIKRTSAQEFVVVGYSPATAAPRAIGALIVGYFDAGCLVYAGRVGTGYTQAVARELWKRLHPLETKRLGFAPIPPGETRRRDARWVEPVTVIEAQFLGWTADGLVRQAVFKGLRDDKPAREVGREAPVATPAQAATGRSSARGAAADKTASAPPPRAGRLARSRSDIRFTNPDRVYWADAGVTKQDLADYYCSVWDRMAPHLVNRPLSLLRCPDGTAGQCFFQKHVSAGVSAANLRTVIDAKGRQIIAVDDLDGVLSLVQAGVLEVHVRGSTLDRLDLCDRIVLDIDPDEDVPWPCVIAAARDVRHRLAAIDLDCRVKLSGGKGLHVVLPIVGAEWDAVKVFAQAVALAMAADDPGRYVAKITKSLRKGKIFIDYLRNSLEQTSVAAYSTRARAGAPVAVPVSWDELGRTKSGNQYTVLNLGKRLAGLAQDPWHDIGRVKQRLPDLRALR